MASLFKGEEVKRSGLYHELPNSELVNDAVQELFQKYSHLEPENNIPHILNIPCIGLFQFCELSLSKHPSYPRVLSALKDPSHPAALFDLGCCFGQDIRKIAFDGAPSKNLVGCDLNREFLDLGYELFRDHGRLQTPMLTADIFRDDGPLTDMEGKMDFVHASLFLHLFDWDKQVEACKQMVKLLKPLPGSTILGRQTGNMVAQERQLPAVANTWRHNDQSFKKMWQQVGEETNTHWNVWVKAEEIKGKHQEAGVCFLTFEVRRES
ncbi:MAG: hypothetical protein LQ343_006051 [Gyalolechia ehrenbergii]|nr:MAG: hypothetical protein LQ343_006051 [Gyalolechia ehrenbergii]